MYGTSMVDLVKKMYRTEGYVLLMDKEEMIVVPPFVRVGSKSFAVKVKSSHKIFCYLAQGSISQRVRTSPNLGLVLGDTKNVRLVLS